MNKFNLKSEEILNKKFGIELSGYSAKEVDLYLDKILEDYRIYEQQVEILLETINEKNQIIKDKQDEIQTYHFELQNLKSQVEKASKASNANLAEEIKIIKQKLNK